HVSFQAHPIDQLAHILQIEVSSLLKNGPPMKSMRSCLAVCFVTALCAQVRADDVEPLMKRLPASANIVAVVQVARILESERARKEGWAENQQTDFLAGASTLPPWVRTFARASHVHPGENGHGWSVAVATTSQDIDMRATADREGGVVQTISRHTAVSSQRNAYFIQIAPRLMGIVSPAYRQDAYRWLNVAESQPMTPSHWLGRVVKEENADIAIAFDTRGMFDPILLQRQLNEFLTRQKKSKQLKQMHSLLMSLEGVCFTANVGVKTKGQHSLEFLN
ncbi:MAG: hypothetical protein AB8G99_25265, partial [Planctomycetaceae bacterium]